MQYIPADEVDSRIRQIESHRSEIQAEFERLKIELELLTSLRQKAVAVISQANGNGPSNGDAAPNGPAAAVCDLLCQHGPMSGANIVRALVQMMASGQILTSAKNPKQNFRQTIRNLVRQERIELRDGRYCLAGEVAIPARR